MTIWKYIFDNGYLQRRDIEDLRRHARRERFAARRAGEALRRNEDLTDRVTHLEDELDELQVTQRALVAYLKARPDWDEAAFWTSLEQAVKLAREVDSPSADESGTDE